MSEIVGVKQLGCINIFISKIGKELSKRITDIEERLRLLESKSNETDETSKQLETQRLQIDAEIRKAVEECIREFCVKNAQLNDEDKKYLESLCNNFVEFFKILCPSRAEITNLGKISCVEEFFKTQKGDKKKTWVFLSAPSSPDPEKIEETREYKVARKLKQELEKRGFGVIWKEGSTIPNDQLPEVARTALGLAFSSVFVGLHFQQTLEKGDFADVLETFASLSGAGDSVKALWGGVGDIDKALPGKRKLKYFTTCQSPTFNAFCPVFLSEAERIVTVSGDDAAICEQILAKILEFKTNEHTPSDYHLEYAVTDENGNEKNDRFLFFPEKTYSNGTPNMRLCMVFKDWNDACCRRENPIYTKCNLYDYKEPTPTPLSSLNYNDYKNDGKFPIVDKIGSNATLKLTFSDSGEKLKFSYWIVIQWKKEEEGKEEEGKKGSTARVHARDREQTQWKKEEGTEEKRKKGSTARVHARDREQTCLFCARPIDIPRRAKSPVKARVAILERSGRTYIRLMKEDGTIAHKDILVPKGATESVKEGKTVKKGTVLYKFKDSEKYKNAKTTCSENKCGAGGESVDTVRPKEKCVTVALLGAPGSGKSTFLSRLFNITPEGKSNIGHSQVAYALTNLAKLESVTDKKYPRIAKVIPFGSTSPAYISFFDVAGASLTSPYATAQREGYFPHHHANGIVLCIDVNNISDANTIIGNYIEQYEKNKSIKVSTSASFEEDSIKDVALAVVLCRFDEIDKDFDENSAIRKTGPAFDRRYQKSDVSQYINNCSGEIKEYLQGRYDTQDVNACNSLLKAVAAFRYQAFFAVSSIGQTEAETEVETDGKKIKKTYFRAEPRNMEYVFAWLLYQTGIIN